jgi:hypothetical protein
LSKDQKTRKRNENKDQLTWALVGNRQEIGDQNYRTAEVRGSNPLGSTSLRSLGELRLGKPQLDLNGAAGEGCRAEVAQQRRQAGRATIPLECSGGLPHHDPNWGAALRRGREARNEI